MQFSEEWRESIDYPGYMVKTIKHGSCTIEAYRPILSDEERKKREDHIATVAGRVLSNYYIRKEREKHEQ